jgi:hypothetical protein
MAVTKARRNISWYHIKLDNFRNVSQQRRAHGLQALVKSNRRLISFERVASGHPLGKAHGTLKTFVGPKRLRWDARRYKQLRSLREVIKLAVFDISHFGKEFQYSANCH